MNPMWFRVFEAWAVTRLLQSPAFHRAVHGVHKRVMRLRHGTPMEELGGTNIDKPGPGLLEHFRKEIKDQLKDLPVVRRK
ncbi:hypothetical protein BU16DRAFT_522422 [Lophium mytilinum]|uniref:Uncharacterized protein n=1 Tax=Lophium mytilinum TaxID=390894 RepID=A0A6A6R9W3_9PEZI|nr:hypothetical protein BU16DRAFT_522422 [Lophium mytilinum]